MSKFKPGDVVRLRSGGPKMTVKKDVALKQHVRATWFDEKHDFLEETFHEDQLELFNQTNDNNKEEINGIDHYCPTVKC